MRYRGLTFDERAKWGVCPTCGAEDGDPCHPEVGLQMGQKVDGSRMKEGDGAHLSRLRKAPEAVKLVPCAVRRAPATKGGG